MIATEAALYGTTSTTYPTSGSSGPRSTTLQVCSCGQEVGGLRREHCPRCGCCLT
ncbi:MAG: hypothetical protein JWR20_1059 [Marmoricola sp.]|jgi:hypothetical protein|nr:hypothetical protein [Marmoricola sp.]